MLPTPLHTLLNNELAELDVFVTLLQREQQALINNKLSELIEFAKEKTLRAQTLTIYAKDRKRLFDVNGIELSPHPPHDMLCARNLPDEALDELATLWRSILKSARMASALNQTNGKLIETRHQQNQQLMTMLMQANGSGSAVLSYDAYGQPKLSRRNAILGKA